MNQNISVDEIAQTLCRASSFYENECPFCIKGRCDYKMWTTFRKEATAVLTLLKNKGIIRKQNLLPALLPGLGG